MAEDHHAENLGEDMPQQPSLLHNHLAPERETLVVEHGAYRATDNLNHSAERGAGLKVVRPRVAAGAPP